MKFLIMFVVLGLSFSVYAKKPKKVMHDKEHHHVTDKADVDHDHDEAHHQTHDHKKHHPTHDEDMKKDGKKHKKHKKIKEQVAAPAPEAAK